MPNMNDMLSDLAKRDGLLVYIEGQEPYDASVIESAEDNGLIRHYMSGGMASTDVVIELTAAGRKHVGMPPRFAWLRRLFVRTRRA